jgi:hypothetical protein
MLTTWLAALRTQAFPKNAGSKLRRHVCNPQVTSAILLAGLVAMLAMTNRWPSFQYGYLMLGQTDTESYRTIAQATPGFPREPLPYHHAQRFWVFWLIGVIAHKSLVSISSSVFGFSLSTIVTEIPLPELPSGTPQGSVLC